MFETMVETHNTLVARAYGAETLLRKLQVFESRIVREVALIVSFNLALIATAQISLTLPFTVVPITGQTFAVLLMAMALGRARAVAVVTLYLTEGALGAPVFAGASGSVAVLMGPTGGYLLGFLVSAYVVGTLADRGWDRRYVLSLVALTSGAAVIFVCGLAQLSFFVETGSLLSLGLYPFLPGAALKIAAAFWLIPTISGIRKQNQ